MRYLFSLSILLTSIFFTSCNSGGVFLPTITGATYDILIVGSDAVWKDSAGIVLNEAFSDPMPCLPEDEDNFKVIHVTNKDFDNIFKPTRNIIFYEVDPNQYTRGSIKFFKNQWAKPQAVAKITAPNLATMKKIVENNRKKLVRYFTDAEEERFLNYYSSYQNLKMSQLIQNKFGVDILVPADLNRLKESDDFVWIANGNRDVSQNLVVFRSPYKSTSDFDPLHLLSVQDSFTKLNIPGPSDGSYMKWQNRRNIESSVLPNRNSDYCVEVRGLWCCHNEKMGGPFVSRNYLSEDRTSIITAMVFLYGPSFDKRNKLRMLESVAGSLKVYQDTLQADTLPSIEVMPE